MEQAVSKTNHLFSPYWELHTYNGSKASECKLGLLQDADVVGDLTDSTSLRQEEYCAHPEAGHLFFKVMQETHSCFSNGSTWQHRNYLIRCRSASGTDPCIELTGHSLIDVVEP